jgi:alcohol dehydrogenase class IV
MKSAKYKFFTPTKLLFGEGCSNDIGKWLKDLGSSRVLLVTDEGLKKIGLAGQIENRIRHEDLTVVTYSDVKENPTVTNVHEGRDLIKKENIDAIVALGGGSSMDAAKAMGILSAHDGSIVEYELGLKPFVKSGPTLIAIPTTSGTGSEATMGAVITDPRTHRKFDVVDPMMAPRLSLVDPLLTVSLPAALTGATGMDALTHAIEGYTATLASPLTDALHLKAIELIGKNLVKAYTDGSDKEARTNIMMASLIAGIGFPNSGLGAVHGLSLPLGGRFNIPHGIANAIILPHVMKFNLSSCPNKFSDIAKTLDGKYKNPEQSVEAVLKLRRELSIPVLRSYDIQLKDLPLLAKDALGRNSNCVTNPKVVTEVNAIEIYSSALAEE